MDKIQINLSTPALVKLRFLAQRWDKSVSEIIRMAVDRLLAQVPGDLELRDASEPIFLSFNLGETKVRSQEMRELLAERSLCDPL